MRASEKRSLAQGMMALLCFVVLLGVVGKIETEDRSHFIPDCAGCHNRQMAMKQYFEHHKVKSPEQMAEAVLITRSPRLMAAINIAGEKKTPHTARNTGWKNRYSGPWQTGPEWGKITAKTSIKEMALIAELALETHCAEESNIVRGLNAYGGVNKADRDTHDYAYNVLAEMTRVP